LSRSVLIVGVSTRAAAESAARSGFDVTALDAFGDLDQHPSVRSLSLPAFTAHSAARVARTIASDAVVFMSSFENHPRAVSALATGRALWGNPPEVLRRVRHPVLLAEALNRRGMDSPASFVTLESYAAAASDGGPTSSAMSASDEEPASYEVSAFRRTVPRDRRWLLKPLASGGGHGVRPWCDEARLPRGCYLQELVEGTPGSIVFVAAGGRAVPLGVSRQLIGEQAFGATPYRYCGSILAAAGDAQFARDEALVKHACVLAQAVAEEFDLVGVNGIDFIACDGVPITVEVNPRWSASMELVERAYGMSVFGAHAAACRDGRLPAFDLVHARRDVGAVGKAVVFARRDVTIGDTATWLADATVRDVPHPGEHIAADRPLCTVFAAGRDGEACHAALVRRAERVYTELAQWSSSKL